MSELRGIARFKFHKGKVEEFKRLSAQAMEIVRTKDTGTLQYDTYFNEDQSECVVLERFRDSEALIEHTANIGDLSEAILATVSVVHGELLGEPSAELRAKLADREVPPLHALPVDVDTVAGPHQGSPLANPMKEANLTMAWGRKGRWPRVTASLRRRHLFLGFQARS